MQSNGVRGYAHVIKEDTRNPNLLFLGTEFGLWVSIDGGQRWAQYKGTNFPAVAVRDLVIHPRTSDLILATHGRGIWIIDDITPWRALTNEVLTEDAGFLPVQPAVQWMETNGGWAEGDGVFTGQSRSTEVFIPYYQRSRHIYGDLKIEILDSAGKLVDTVPTSKHRGVSRATWSMHMKPPRVPPAAIAAFGAAIGPRVLPGVYTVRMTRGERSTTRSSPSRSTRAQFTVEDRKQQFELVNRIGALLNRRAMPSTPSSPPAINQSATKAEKTAALENPHQNRRHQGRRRHHRRGAPPANTSRSLWRCQRLRRPPHKFTGRAHRRLARELEDVIRIHHPHRHQTMRPLALALLCTAPVLAQTGVVTKLQLPPASTSPAPPHLFRLRPRAVRRRQAHALHDLHGWQRLAPQRPGRLR